MWMRFDATTRRPPSSSILVTAPVRLRRVASGLMIEKVRVTAMTGRGSIFWVVAGFVSALRLMRHGGQDQRLVAQRARSEVARRTGQHRARRAYRPGAGGDCE